MPTTELLTLILSIVAIVFAIVAIVFEVSFFVLQRNEARTLTKNIQDLVFQAVRNEKGIDQLSGQTMRLIERLVEARVSADRAQVAPEVEKVVAQLQTSVATIEQELGQRIQVSSDEQPLKEEMEQKLEALRAQIAQVARRAGRTAAASRPQVVEDTRAYDVLRVINMVHERGGEVENDGINQVLIDLAPGVSDGTWSRCEDLGLLHIDDQGMRLTTLGRRLAERADNTVINTVHAIEKKGTGLTVTTFAAEGGYDEFDL